MTHSDSWDHLTQVTTDTGSAGFSGAIPGRFPRRFRQASRILLLLLFLGAFNVQRAKAADCTSLTFLSQPPSSVIFVGDFESGVLETWGSDRVFSAVEVLDLEILVGFEQSLTGDHLLEISLKTPNGHLYQKLVTPISSDTKRSGVLKKIPGFPRPSPIQALSRKRIEGKDMETTVLSLPVGGTSIETASMYGHWSVEIFLDGQQLMCGSDVSFMIIP